MKEFEKVTELSDNELEQATGGNGNPQGAVDVEELGGFSIGTEVNIVERYFSDSYASGNYTARVGKCATIGRIISGRPAPYRLDINGEAIGWGDSTTISY